MIASSKFTVIKTVSIILCASGRLELPFYIAQKVGKLLGIGAGFGVKKEQSQEIVVESRKIENTEYYCHCSLPSS